MLIEQSSNKDIPERTNYMLPVEIKYFSQIKENATIKGGKQSKSTRAAG